MAVYIAFFMAIGVGASSLIARSIGSGDMIRAQVLAKQSTILAIFFGLIFGVISLFFSENLLLIMGAKQEVLELGSVYLQIVGTSSVFISLMLMFGSILRANGDTKRPMYVSWWMNILNIGLDYVFNIGIAGWLGWGVAGAAWATVIVRIFGTIALYYYIRKSELYFSLFDKID